MPVRADPSALASYGVVVPVRVSNAVFVSNARSCRELDYYYYYSLFPFSPRKGKKKAKQRKNQDPLARLSTYSPVVSLTCLYTGIFDLSALKL